MSRGGVNTRPAGVAGGASSRGPRVSDTAAPSSARAAPVYMASE